MPSVTIVIPIHNEATFLDALIPQMAQDVVDATGGPHELIMVENGSTDRTAELAHTWCKRLSDAGWKAQVVVLPDADYGAAMRRGFEVASGDWVVNFDIDYFSGPFVAALETNNADVVIASKRAKDSHDNRSVLRRIGTFGFNLLLRWLVGSRVSDTHGIKAFRSQALRTMLPSVRSTKDLFDTELVIRCERAGFTIGEVPIVVEERRTARTPFVRRIPRTLRGLFRLRAAFRQERRQADTV